MWDTSYAIPSLFLMLLFVGFYFSLPRIPNRMNHSFVMLLSVEACTIIFNFLSTWADMYYYALPRAVVEIANVLFFVLFYQRPYTFFLFIISALKIEAYFTRSFSILRRIPLQLCVLVAVSSPWTGFVYSIEEDGYHSGPYYHILYMEFWFYVLLVYLIVFIYKGSFSRREKISVFSCNTILLIGTIFRLRFPYVLLMDTFCLMAVTILYLTFENPEFYLLRGTRIFNGRALREYIEEVNGKKPYKIYAFVLHNYKDIREIYGAKQMDEGIALIGDYLIKSFPKLIVFYSQSGRFILIGDEKQDMTMVRHIVEGRFYQPWTSQDAELFLGIGSVHIDATQKLSSADTAIVLLNESLNHVSNVSAESYIYIDEKEIEKTDKQTDVKRALEYSVEHHLVEAYLQPIVKSGSHELIGAEALARIKDLEGNLISPDKFIPIAERNGRINQLGEQVLERVCDFICSQDMKKLGISWINVNLSPIQFMRQDLDKRLLWIIRGKGVDPAYIHLEVTEEAMIDETLLLKQIQNIQSTGFYFVLDDYGKGYSNLSRLKKCPFINVKIDMSIVWEYMNNPDEVLPNMIKTFKKLGFSITAEGIENEEMADAMRDIGCDYLQGFYFSKALTMEQFIDKYS